ncbi:BURP domain-containing protein 3 [Bienertia sinuspersici]
MKTCEVKGVKDEKRFCATSLEGMVDYVTSTLNSQRNKLTIQQVQKLGSDDNHKMVCHKMSNPYVFVSLSQHKENTDIYGVSLAGDLVLTESKERQ